MNRNIILFLLLFGCTLIATIKDVMQKNVGQKECKTIKTLLINLVKTDATFHVGNGSGGQYLDYPCLLRFTLPR